MCRAAPLVALIEGKVATGTRPMFAMRGCATWHTSFLSDLRRNECRKGRCLATTRVCHVAHFSTFPVGLAGIRRQTPCTCVPVILRDRWLGRATRIIEPPAYADPRAILNLLRRTLD